MKPAVLVVDDSLTVRMDLGEAFEGAGFGVRLCSTLQEARTALAQQPAFALVVLDVLLPDGDGIEFLAGLKRSPASASLPVMLLSTEAQVQDRVRGLETGADEYVGKPYEPSYVVARATELIRARHSPREGSAPPVLVIDDSPTFLHGMQQILEDAGYKVLKASSGEEGLRAAVDQRPAAIMIDSRLPGIDGATVVRRLREDAALRRTPCLLLTASDDPMEELRALEAGADSFARKDEDPALMLARLVAMLRAARTPSAVASNSGFLGPKRILAVDDSASFLEELAAQLRQEGYDLILARSGEEALKLLALQSVDCVLLDVVMPGLSGNEICRRIKESPVLRNTPLLMLTSLDGQRPMLEGIDAGADDYISKSGDFDVLRARVRAALRRKQFEDENRGVQEQLLRKELEAAEARAQRELAETRAALLERLRESEDRAQLAAEAADLGVWHWDLVTGQQVWSPRCKALFGLPPEATPTSALFMGCVHPEDRHRVEAAFREALAGRTDYDIEYRALWPDGSLHWIASKGRAYHDQLGQTVRMTGVTMDVTGRKQTEEALVRSEKLASVGRMAATMAHEINNPLEAVMNALFLMSCDGALGSETRASLELAQRELDRVAHMTKQTLGFYREHARPATVHLPAIVDELAGLYARKLGYKRISLKRAYGGAGQVDGVAGELRQIVSNLMANSIDAVSPQGTIYVRIADFRQKHYGIRLTIADDGSGIGRSDLSSIFEPFFTTKKEVGTGLGLWVTRQIVEKHGGSIRVRSKTGKGSVFSVYLPLHQEPGTATTTSQGHAASR